MTLCQNLDREATIARLSTAQSYERRLDGLVWLNSGCDYPRTGRNHFPPCGPANRVNGRTMRQGYELGLSGVEAAFCVPELTIDIGAAFRLLAVWFPVHRLDLRTGLGGNIGQHRAVLEVGGIKPFVGTSPLSPAAATCVCMLKAIPHADHDPAGYSTETSDEW